MSPLLLVTVGFGGALGALCRSKATGFLKARTHGDFPRSDAHHQHLLVHLGGNRLGGSG